MLVIDAAAAAPKYLMSLSFDEVETTDVRIVFTKSGGTIPNIMELELMSASKEGLPMFRGLTPVDDTEPVLTPYDSKEIEENKISPWVYLPLIVAVAIAIGNCIFLVVKNKKKEDKNGK